MSAIMKEHYIPGHPGYDKFMKLVKQGCPRCKEERLFQKGCWPIGEMYCGNVQECAYEFKYDGNGHWEPGDDGKPGSINERFRFYTQTEDFKRKLMEAKANKK